MKIRFYNISENDFFDKVLETLPVFYPKLLSLNVYAEDGTHNLPTHTEELFSKTVSFLKHIYFSNQSVKISIIETSKETDVDLNYFDGYQEYQTNSLNLDLVFRHLYPLEVIIDNTSYYYSYEASEKPQDSYFQSSKKVELHSTQIDDYIFNYNSRMYRKFFTFQEISDGLFKYSYKTFLPENVTPEHLIRLMLLSISHQNENFSLIKRVKKSSKLIINNDELTSNKHILFSIPFISLSGKLAPIKKELYIELNNA